MAFTAGKFIEPNGSPSGGTQAMQSSTYGPSDVEDAKKAAFRGTGTGVVSFGGLSINTDNTLFDIGRVVAQVIDHTDPENPTITQVDRAATTGESTPYLTTSNITHIAVNSSGALVLSPTPFTNSQHRSLAYVGLVAHVDRTVISVTVNEPTLCYNTSPEAQDMMRNFGTLNVKGGNIYSGNSSDLSLSKTAGWLQAVGINAFTNPLDPNVLAVPSSALVSNILKVFSDDSNELLTGANNSQINPNVWEDIDGVGAGLANEQTVPSNKWTNQLIVMFQEGRTNIQVGQKLYASKDEALADIGASGYVVAPVIKQLAVRLAVLTIKVGTTDFSDPANFAITPAETPHGIML